MQVAWCLFCLASLLRCCHVDEVCMCCIIRMNFVPVKAKRPGSQTVTCTHPFSPRMPGHALGPAKHCHSQMNPIEVHCKRGCACTWHLESVPTFWLTPCTPCCNALWLSERGW